MAQESFYGGRQGNSCVIVARYPSIAAMKQDFEAGGATVKKVNYGEYVLIDTVNKNDEDNGKLFRRGMNLENEFKGGEYIGQICGPDGKIKNIEITYYDDDEFNTEDQKDPGDGYFDTINGLVPGKDENNYNDRINYRQTHIIDGHGNIIKYLIGLKIPFLVTYFNGNVRSPYYTIEDDVDPSLIGTPIQSNFDLLLDNEESSTDRDPSHGDTGHPFQRKYRIGIPKGIKGDTSNNIKLFPSKIKANSNLYNSKSSSSIAIILPEDTEIKINTYYDDYDEIYQRVRVEYNGSIYQANSSDGKDYHYGYLETIYDNNINGESVQKDIGSYKIIDRLELNENGIITVYYTCGNPEELQEVLRQIYLEDDNTKGIQLDDDGSVIIQYNTMDEHDQHEHQDYLNLLTQITKINLSDTGEFKIYFNNDKIKDAVEAEGGTQDTINHAYETNLKQVKDLIVEDNGDLVLTYCDNTTYTLQKKVKWIKDVSIDTGVTEGMGDQKIYITYNNNSTPQAIGNPINYIVETLISEGNNEQGVPSSHLLVYYSDPVYRSNLNPSYTYRSEKDGIVKTGQADLGYAKGPSGGVHIIGNVSTINDLYRDGATRQNPYTPEDFGGSPDYEGWVMTVGDESDPESIKTIFAFDYTVDPTQKEAQYYVGPLSASSIIPDFIIDISTADIEPINLVNKGIQLVSKTRVTV